MDRFIIVMDRERMKRVDYLVVFPIDLDSEAEKRRRRVKGVPCERVDTIIHSSRDTFSLPGTQLQPSQILRSRNGSS